ncbi:MAG: protein-L-isoaspartate(D-aspartate) O-methyltransferase [Planctomycetota bacterium]
MVPALEIRDPRPESRDDPFVAERRSMVETHLAARGIRDARVLAAMRTVPRHRFVPEAERARAYSDAALPIGFGQTISQPYVVARSLEALALGGTERVLEVGTGCGYQAAVLAELAAEVFTVEIVPELAAIAVATLGALCYRNVHVRVGDGGEGWPDRAPFDAIVVAAAAPEVPRSWLRQLSRGGRMVAPVGDAKQTLLLLQKPGAGEVVRQPLLPVRFVPLRGRFGRVAAPPDA